MGSEVEETMKTVPAAQRLLSMPLGADAHFDAKQVVAAFEGAERCSQCEEVEIAVAAAVNAARAEMEQEAAVQFERIESAHRQELRRLADEKLAAMALQIDSSIGQIKSEISLIVARILLPFVQNEMQKQIVLGFGNEILSLRKAEPTASLKVSGPPDLMAMVRSQLDVEELGLSIEENTDPELRLTLESMIVETRLGEWLSALGAAGS